MFLKRVIYPTSVLAKVLRVSKVFITVSALPGITCDKPEGPASGQQDADPVGDGRTQCVARIFLSCVC